MTNDYLMGGPMPYRGATGYAPSYLSTIAPQNNNTNTNIVWTMGLESAKAYPLFPGKTVMLMDSESPRFFIKSVDNNGYATLKSYTFREETFQPTNAAKPVATADFITREQLREELSKFAEQLRATNGGEELTEKVEVEVEKTKTKNLL